MVVLWLAYTVLRDSERSCTEPVDYVMTSDRPLEHEAWCSVGSRVKAEAQHLLSLGKGPGLVPS